MTKRERTRATGCERHPEVTSCPPCARCGAPQCCPKCCEEASAEVKEPTMTEFERAAEELIRQQYGDVQECDRPFIQRIVALLTSHARPAAGFIREATGPDRKVLGTLPVTADGCVFVHGAVYRVGFYGGKPHIFVSPAVARWNGTGMYIAHVTGERVALAYGTKQGAEQWFADNGHEPPSIDANYCEKCGHSLMLDSDTQTRKCYGWCFRATPAAAQAERGDQCCHRDHDYDGNCDIQKPAREAEWGEGSTREVVEESIRASKEPGTWASAREAGKERGE